ncbi:MAG: hypothetical protein AAFU71_06025 [Cyanobacteria bacterium J06632_22]
MSQPPATPSADDQRPKYRRPESKRFGSRWFWPLVVLSVGLHGGLLLVPMPDIEKPEAVVEEEDSEVIEVVTLPDVAPLPAAADIEAPPAVAPPPPEPVAPEPAASELVVPSPVIEPAVEPYGVEPLTPEPPIAESDPAPAVTDPGPPTLAQRLADPDQYVSYAKTDTEENFYRSVSTDWYGVVFSAYGSIPGKYNPDPSIVVETPLCPTPLPPSEVEVGVVVNPDGSLEGEPVTLRSTGYDVLNEQVLELVKAHAYPATGAVAAYEVKIFVTAMCS